MSAVDAAAGRVALITGCSTGIGRATALRLDADGWIVFAGVRKQVDADALAAESSERSATVYGVSCGHGKSRRSQSSRGASPPRSGRAA